MDVVLRKLGYVHLERSSDQSFQTSFVNGAMVKDAIAENAVTVLFSDEVRQQSGKFCLKTDKTVEWLKTLDESVTVIPVSINYDRVLEIDNLVNEMLSRPNEAPCLFSLLRNLRKDQLGRIFVNFGKPLDNVENLALEQQRMNPITLPMLVASLLLHQTTDFTQLLSSCVKLYTWIRRRQYHTLMSVEPNKVAVERAV
jgi:hypothetical protein